MLVECKHEFVTSKYAANKYRVFIQRDIYQSQNHVSLNLHTVLSTMNPGFEIICISDRIFVVKTGFISISREQNIRITCTAHLTFHSLYFNSLKIPHLQTRDHVSSLTYLSKAAITNTMQIIPGHEQEL